VLPDPDEESAVTFDTASRAVAAASVQDPTRRPGGQRRTDTLDQLFVDTAIASPRQITGRRKLIFMGKRLTTTATMPNASPRRDAGTCSPN